MFVVIRKRRVVNFKVNILNRRSPINRRCFLYNRCRLFSKHDELTKICKYTIIKYEILERFGRFLYEFLSNNSNSYVINGTK